MMRIKTLSLTNFRAFQDTQVIEFAPVTLLFGSNSVGKSTVVTALCYLHQLLSLGDCEPRRLLLSGNKFIGGFAHLVNGKDLNKKMRLKVEFDVTSAEELHCYVDSLFYLQQNPTIANDALWQECQPLLNSVAKQATSMAVEVEVSWCQQHHMAYVSQCRTWMNGHELTTLQAAQAGTQAIVSQICLIHPLLNVSAEQASCLHERLGLTQQEHVVIESQQGALPVLGQRINSLISCPDGLLKRRVEEVISDCVVAPLDNLAQLLSRLINIGPLRQIPDSTYTAGKFIQQSDWYSGKAGWDRLYQSNQHEIAQVNKWLGGKDQFDLGYAFVFKKVFKQVQYANDPDLFSRYTYQQIEGEQGDIALDKVVSFQHSEKEAITLWDLVNDLEVAASDIGAGISQVLPLVMSSVSAQSSLICCEQPELHIHPRAQVALGDLLTQNDERNHYLIETHSEHLVLRLLRRIRETTEQRLPEYMQDVSPDDISIMYLQGTEQGVIAKRTRITSDGDLDCDWPEGFFDERDEELF
ncbi:DUF3696 domain-containing protein [Vibrio porteresiae]|uniref:DUF3696 domain-containing protein n=1 Tax=Vibrio porteresiae DSM 19223 TaxID=1123496 RepID=A0ABZ0QHN7_9VIBR|nr:DUF3696 domain-containing protein [Vibrio porteresiae]WPC76016.1 DUF3696 domain-containing protein [Vibrio porteresiae DSM 19223]